MFREKIIIAGFGGQGALRIGQMLAYAALKKDWEAEWLPSYGAEMRGGTANCNVTISDGEILFPMITEADTCIILNNASLDRFQNSLKKDGLLLLDSSIVTKKAEREDCRILMIPADRIAEEEGNTKGANMVMLGGYLAASGKIEPELIYGIIEQQFTGSKAKYADSNKRLVKRGYDFVKEFR